MYHPQSNFITPFAMSPIYYREHVKESLRLLEYCWNFIYEKDQEIKLYRQVASVELRKLLCDEKPSIFSVDSNPKFTSFNLKYTEISDPHIETVFEVLPKQMIPSKPNLMSLDKWLSQKIIHYNRKKEDMPNIIDAITFQSIKENLFDSSYRENFFSYFKATTIEYENEQLDAYERIDPDNSEQTKDIFRILNRVGYNFIDVRRIIKLVANKLGAHTSPDHPIALFHLNLDEKPPIHFDVILCRVIVDLKRILGNE